MNLGVLGLIGGIGKGVSEAGAAWGAGLNERAKEERSLIQQETLLKYRDDMEEAKRQRIAGQVLEGAQAIADTRAQAQTGLLSANAQAADELFPPGMSSSGTEGASPVTPVKGLITNRDRMTTMAQLDPEKHTKDLLQIEQQDRAAAALEAKTAKDERETARKEKHDEDWRQNEAEQRKNEAKRVEAMFAKIGNGKDTTPKRIEEAKQMMELVNKDRKAAGKPLMTIEEAFDKHFKGEDPTKAILGVFKALIPQGDDPSATMDTAKSVVEKAGGKVSGNASGSRASQFKVLR